MPTVKNVTHAGPVGMGYPLDLDDGIVLAPNATAAVGLDPTWQRVLGYISSGELLLTDGVNPTVDPINSAPTVQAELPLGQKTMDQSVSSVFAVDQTSIPTTLRDSLGNFVDLFPPGSSIPTFLNSLTTEQTLKAANPQRKGVSVIAFSTDRIYVATFAGLSTSLCTAVLKPMVNNIPSYWEPPDTNYKGIITFLSSGTNGFVVGVEYV